jgi:hypothetical protein
MFNQPRSPAASRRAFLNGLGGGAALASTPFLPTGSALAAEPALETEFFIFLHASGGWDVTLWADPRNEKRGIIDPANTDTSHLHRWDADPEAIRRWLAPAP